MELTLDTGRTMDPHITYDQIGKWPLIRVGAVNRAHGRDHVRFDISCDGRRRKRVFIQLNGGDLYNIEVLDVRRLTEPLEWITLFIARDIDAANLSETVERACQDVMV